MPEARASGIVSLDVTARVRSIIGYSVGTALYAFVIVALYPTFEHSTSLDNLVRNDATAAALFGVSGSITSSGGWLNANLVANFYPLLMLLLTIGYGAGSIAGQDENGTLCLVATLPITRRRILAEKVVAMCVQATVLAVAVALCIVIGRWFDLTTSPVEAFATSGTVLALGVDLGIVAMAIGAWTGRRGTALGATTAIAAASYLVSSLAPVVSWIAPARYGSLFYWAVGHNQIADGVSGWDVLALLGVGLVAYAAARAAFARLDLH